MTAQRLRDAAQKIRDTATAAAECTGTPTDPWVAQLSRSGDAYYDVASTSALAAELPVARKMNEEEAVYVALWSPPVALAVADWLDRSASEARLADNRQALAVADLILGTQP